MVERADEEAAERSEPQKWRYEGYSEELDLSRAVYSLDLKIAPMRALDAGCHDLRDRPQIPGESPSAGTLPGRVAGQGRPGFSRGRPRGASLPALDDARCIAQLERKIGQLTMENGFLKKVKNYLTHPRHTGTIDIFEGFVSDPLNPPPRWMSAAGRRAISGATKRRWAAFRKAQGK